MYVVAKLGRPLLTFQLCHVSSVFAQAIWKMLSASRVVPTASAHVSGDMGSASCRQRLSMPSLSFSQLAQLAHDLAQMPRMRGVYGWPEHRPWSRLEKKFGRLSAVQFMPNSEVA